MQRKKEEFSQTIVKLFIFVGKTVKYLIFNIYAPK